MAARELTPISPQDHSDHAPGATGPWSDHLAAQMSVEAIWSGSDTPAL